MSVDATTDTFDDGRTPYHLLAGSEKSLADVQNREITDGINRAETSQLEPLQRTQATLGEWPKVLNAEHARRIAHNCIFEAIWESRATLGGVKYEEACALADAYSADFIERVETYTKNFNAVAEDLKRRG